MPSSYPLDIEVYAPDHLARWRPLFNWLIVIPADVWASILAFGAVFAVIAGWFAIVASGELPESLGNYLMAVLRYQLRVQGYLYGLADRYPAFAVPAGYVDPGDYQTVVYSARAIRRDRVSVLFRAVLAIPQLVVLYFVGIVASVVAMLAWFAVLATGRWPAAMRDFFVGYLRWSTRVAAYLYLVTDLYPPFGMQP